MPRGIRNKKRKSPSAGLGAAVDKKRIGKMSDRAREIIARARRWRAERDAFIAGRPVPAQRRA